VQCKVKLKKAFLMPYFSSNKGKITILTLTQDSVGSRINVRLNNVILPEGSEVRVGILYSVSRENGMTLCVRPSPLSPPTFLNLEG